MCTYSIGQRKVSTIPHGNAMASRTKDPDDAQNYTIAKRLQQAANFHVSEDEHATNQERFSNRGSFRMSMSSGSSKLTESTPQTRNQQSSFGRRTLNQEMRQEPIRNLGYERDEGSSFSGEQETYEEIQNFGDKNAKEKARSKGIDLEMKEDNCPTKYL